MAEMIVYIAILSVLFIALVSMMGHISTIERRAGTFLDINSAAVTAFSRFSRDIRRATSLDTTNSTLNATPGRLELLMKKSDGTNDRVTFYLSGGVIKTDQNGVFAGNITQDSMEVSNLTFRNFSTASSTAVRVEMTVAPSASSSVPALNFYGTYVLRGSYVE